MAITYKDLRILFEDNHLIVVEKPQGVLSQSDASKEPDMCTLLAQYRKDNENKPGDAFIGCVHRLDKDTGGVMVFAKTSKAAERLNEQKENGTFEKKYLTVVEGEVPGKNGTLINYLKQYEGQDKVSVVPMAEDGAKKAELEYRVLDVKNDLSLLEIKLVTGRKNQIRVQMATIGHPIVGDVKYGNGLKYKLKLPLSLWASELKFAHPINKETMVFRVYPPEILPWTAFNVEKYLLINMKNCDRWSDEEK